MEEVGSPSQSSGDSEIRSQYRSCEEEEDLPSKETPELRANVGELIDLGAYAEIREATIVCPIS